MTAAMRDALAFGEATALSTLEAPHGGAVVVPLDDGTAT